MMRGTLDRTSVHIAKFNDNLYAIIQTYHLICVAHCMHLHKNLTSYAGSRKGSGRSAVRLHG